jgi:hypothetical protein
MCTWGRELIVGQASLYERFPYNAMKYHWVTLLFSNNQVGSLNFSLILKLFPCFTIEPSQISRAAFCVG